MNPDWLPSRDERLSRAPRPVKAVAGGVRPRVDGDLDECVRLLEAVHRADAYPMYWPGRPSTVAHSPSNARRLGRRGRSSHRRPHRAPRRQCDASARVWAEATGLPPEEFGSISRLLVSLECRGAGIGRELLDAACAEATARGLHPALDVVETNRDAIRLYEQRGWRRVFSEPWAVANGNTLLHYYVAPLGNTNEKS